MSTLYERIDIGEVRRGDILVNQDTLESCVVTEIFGESVIASRTIQIKDLRKWLRLKKDVVNNKAGHEQTG
jgi:hypothetical protein